MTTETTGKTMPTCTIGGGEVLALGNHFITGGYDNGTLGGISNEESTIVSTAG